MSAIVTLSMIATPLLVRAAAAHRRDGAQSVDDLEGPQGGRDHVVVVGFGRMGQIVAQVLNSSGLM